MLGGLLYWSPIGGLLDSHLQHLHRAAGGRMVNGASFPQIYGERGLFHHKSGERGPVHSTPPAA